MAWTNENKEDIKITISIVNNLGNRQNYGEEELKIHNIAANKVLQSIQQECIEFIIQNDQLGKKNCNKKEENAR